MKQTIFSILLILTFISTRSAYAGFWGMNSPTSKPTQQQSSSNQIQPTQENIPIFDNVDKHIQKRREEAYKLVQEGKKLIKKGEKKNRQDLIVRGKIKKDIGEKQLQVLKEQAEDKKVQDHRDEW